MNKSKLRPKDLRYQSWQDEDEEFSFYGDAAVKRELGKYSREEKIKSRRHQQKQKVSVTQGY